jgi:hypothetical protein
MRWRGTVTPEVSAFSNSTGSSSACRVAWREHETTPALVPAQRNRLLAFVLLAAGAGVGLLAGRG